MPITYCVLKHFFPVVKAQCRLIKNQHERTSVPEFVENMEGISCSLILQTLLHKGYVHPSTPSARN